MHARITPQSLVTAVRRLTTTSLFAVAATTGIAVPEWAAAAIVVTPPVFQSGGGLDPGDLASSSGDQVFDASTRVTLATGALLRIDDGSLLQAGAMRLILADGVDAPLLQVFGTAGAGTPSRVTLNGSVDRLVIDEAGEIFITDGAVLDAATDAASCVLSTCNVYLGRVLGSTARLDVTGAGSGFTALNQLVIAGAEQGFGPAPLSSAAVNVTGGGRIDSGDVTLSTGTSNTQFSTFGSATIVGANSTWGAGRFWAANGDRAEARIDVTNDGTLALSDQLVLGSGLASSGQMTISQGGTVLLAGGIDNPAITIGANGATAVVDVDGGSLRIAGLPSRDTQLRVGLSGNGTLNVVGGGEVRITEGTSIPAGSSGVSIGADTFGPIPGNGLLNVSGAGSRFILERGHPGDIFLQAGSGTTGTIVVADGGRLAVDSLSISSVFIGNGSAGIGTLDITGAGSRVDITGASTDLRLAVNAGTGLVNVSEGGALSLSPTTAGAARILMGGGNAEPGSTSINVASGGSIFVDGSIEISRSFAQTTDVIHSLIVGDGGSVTATRRIRINAGGLLGGSGTITTDRLEFNEFGTLAAENLIFADVRELAVLPLASLVVEHNVTVGNGLANLVAEFLSSVEITGDLTVRSATGSSASTSIDGATLFRVLGGDIIVGGGGGTDVFTVRDGGFLETVDQGPGTRLLVGTGGLFETTDAETYAFIEGDIDVLGGELRIGEGTLVESFTTLIADGGLLSGTGLLRSLDVTVGNGGTLSPGLSPGRLDVTGELTVDGGTLLFEIGGTDPGSYDVLAVSGSASPGDFNFLAGDFVLRLINGYVPTQGTELRLIEAEGALFVDTDVDFLYDGFGPDYTFSVRPFTDLQGDTLNGGYVTFLATDIAIDLAGLTPNSASMAEGLNQLCPLIEGLEAPTADQVDLDRLCGGLRNVNTTDEQLLDGLAALTPEEITGTLNTLLRYTTLQHGNLAQRINGLRYGGKRVDFSGIDLRFDQHVIAGRDLQRMFDRLTGGAASADEDFSRWGFFGNGAFSRGDKDPTPNESGFEFDGATLTLGADYRIADNLFVGAALGYNDLAADFDAGGGLDFTALSVSLFGTWLYRDAGYLDILGTWGTSETDTERQLVYMDAIGPIDRTARADADGDQLMASVGGGWDFEAAGFIFGPHAGLNFSEVSVDELQERGAAGANLLLPDQEVRSLTANAGLHVSYTFLPSFGVLVPHARLDYVREFEDDAETINIRFVNDPFADDSLTPTNPIAIRTDEPDSDYLVWSVGASAQFTQGVAAFVNYRGSSLIEDVTLGELTVGLRMERSF
jgi:uncharacterized protein YhjY with autotransporter beta-barrel domain